MNNGRKISSKYFPVLIFALLFLSVTLNSPANYLHAPHFYKNLTTFSDTAKPVRKIPKDTRHK